jgi:hypothetical protein
MMELLIFELNSLKGVAIAMLFGVAVLAKSRREPDVIIHCERAHLPTGRAMLQYLPFFLVVFLVIISSIEVQ